MSVCSDVSVAHFEVLLLWHHDVNHDGRCKAIRICATESGKGDQEACYEKEGVEEGEKGSVCQMAQR